jgi:CheY-like chemotaxis protein
MPDSSTPRPEENQAVVIADADRANVQHVERLLRRSGVKNPILSFGEGMELQAYLAGAAQHGAHPCVLFLDPRMPGANGYNPIRWIRHDPVLREMKVVVFSSTNYPEEIEGAGELGVHLFLKKHPELNSLSTIVNHLCGVQQEERRPWNQYPAAAPGDR